MRYSQEKKKDTERCVVRREKRRIQKDVYPQEKKRYKIKRYYPQKREQILGKREMMSERKEITALWEQAKKRAEAGRKAYLPDREECELVFSGEIPHIRFLAFAPYPELTAAFSTRFGGVSAGCFSALNLGFGRGDSEETVSRNYRIFCDSIGVDAERLVLSDQVHRTDVRIVTGADACGSEIHKTLTETDGLATGEKGLCLVTSYADCVPLFFYDPVKKVAASSHSGWKGTAARMGEKTIQALERGFGCERNHLVAVIGPSICQDCYEVSEEVVRAFYRTYPESQVRQFVQTGKRPGKYQLDLWEANYLQLTSCGVPEENVHVAGVCTCCNSRLFFSHRASGGKRGNLCGFLSVQGSCF